MNKKETICMCIDIRNSTNFHEKCNDLAEATKIISKFIEEIYQTIEVEPGDWNKFLYAGDGIMFIRHLNSNETDSTKSFINFIEAAMKAEKVVLEYEKKYQKQEFKAGIALDYGECIETAVENIPNEPGKKTKLYVGYPISRSTKICKTLPLERKNKVCRHIGLSKDFFDKLLKKEQENYKFKLTSSKKKAIQYD